MKRLLISLSILTAILVSTLAEGAPQGGPITAPQRPNIVLFLVDDMATADIQYMPALSQLAQAGVQFTRFVSPTPVCEPSRASLLRGQHSHNTFQLADKGFDSFYLMGLEKETIAAWLQRAGYATGLFGKYLNGYMQSRYTNKNYFPPGWSEWYGGGSQLQNYNFILNENGIVKEYKDGPHLDDLLADYAVNFIDRHHSQPMFLYIASKSPHLSSIPAHRYEGSFKDVQLPQSPSFNEDDVSDKPVYVQGKPNVSADAPVRLENFRNRLRTLLSVEDLIKAVIAALDKYQIRDNTYFIFMSDNGWQYGEHRIPSGKLTPYKPSNVVPAWIWGPGIPAGVTRDHLVANLDIAPTIAEWAQVSVPGFVDGRSLVPLLSSNPTALSDWRQAMLLAHQQSLFKPWPLVGDPWPPSYFGLLTNTEKYVHYDTLEQELYLDDADPYEMKSQHTNPIWKEKMQQMYRWARAFGTCRGETCRQIDRLPPS